MLERQRTARPRAARRGVHCHIFDIDADSWRQKESLAMSETRPKSKEEATEMGASTSAKKR